MVKFVVDVNRFILKIKYNTMQKLQRVESFTAPAHAVKAIEDVYKHINRLIKKQNEIIDKINNPDENAHLIKIVEIWNKHIRLNCQDHVSFIKHLEQYLKHHKLIL